MNKRQRTKWFKRQLLEYGARVVREEKNPPRKDYLPYKKRGVITYALNIL